MKILLQLCIYAGFLAAVGLVYGLGLILCAVKRREKRRRRERKYLRHMETIDGLLENFHRRPTEFENYMAMVFEAQGYEDVEVTRAARDGGKDIIMYRDGEKYVVEVKLYSPQYKVGREKIQKLHSAVLDSESAGACFVTTSSFTRDALEYAEKHGIDTIDGVFLAAMVEDMESGRTTYRPDGGFLEREIGEGLEEEREEDIRRLRSGAAALLSCYLVYGVVMIGLSGGRQLWYETAFLALLMALDLRLVLKALPKRRVTA